LESEPGLFFYETWAHPGFTLEEAADYADFWRVSAEQGRAHNFAVEALDTGAYLGSCGLFGIEADHGVAGLGFWTRGSAQRRGVATEAASLVAGFGFDHLGLNRIELLIAVSNDASHRLAEKLGAIVEGTLRRRLVLGGQPRDAVLYRLLRPGSVSAG
jgi:RimJ/RimL family protein N-acetyltransferase